MNRTDARTWMTAIALLMASGCLSGNAKVSISTDGTGDATPPAAQEIALYHFAGTLQGANPPHPAQPGPLADPTGTTKADKFAVTQPNLTIQFAATVGGGATNAGAGRVEVRNPGGTLVYSTAIAGGASTVSLNLQSGTGGSLKQAPRGEYSVRYYASGVLDFVVDAKGTLAAVEGAAALNCTKVEPTTYYHFAGSVQGSTPPHPQNAGPLVDKAAPTKTEKFTVKDGNRSLAVTAKLGSGQTDAGVGRIEIYGPKGDQVYSTPAQAATATGSFTFQGGRAASGNATLGEYEVRYYIAGALTAAVDVTGVVPLPKGCD